MPVNLEKQRAVLVTPDPSRLEGTQVETKKRPQRPKTGQGDASAKVAGEFPCKSMLSLCGKLQYTTAGGESRGGEPAALPHCEQARGQARRPALRRSRPAHWRSAALKEARPPQC